MATQYKKIQNKIHPKEDDKPKADLKPKASRDALLLVLIAVTLVILVLAWSNMDGIGRGMYGGDCLHQQAHGVQRQGAQGPHRHQLRPDAGIHLPAGTEHVQSVLRLNRRTTSNQPDKNPLLHICQRRSSRGFLLTLKIAFNYLASLFRSFCRNFGLH